MTSFLKTFDQTRRNQTSLMWSYGSNLNVRQMAGRCPGARKLKALPVYGAKLVFRGVADVQITDNPADVALGGLWRITRENERALDRYEGVSSGMYTKEYFYIRDKSRHYHRVLYYRMTSTGIFPPGEGYLYSIVEGYSDFGLDLTKLDEAVRHSWQDKHKTDDMRDRYLRHRPILAKSIEQARRPMISAPKPKSSRLAPLQPLNNPPRSSGVPAPREVPKHQPRWPVLGPHSKLLPAPKSTAPTSPKRAPPLESIFPQTVEPARLSGNDNPLTEYRDRAAWLTHATDDGYYIESKADEHFAIEAWGKTVGYFNETENVGFLPKKPEPLPTPTASDQLPHGED